MTVPNVPFANMSHFILQVTSSPFRDLNIHKTPLKTQVSDSESVLQSSFVGDPWNSPVLSPIKDDNSDDIALSFTRIDSPDASFDLSELSIEKNVESSDLEMSRNDGEMRDAPFDGEMGEEPFDIQRDANTMSAEPLELVLDVKESTRLPLIEFTGFSPIRNEDDMEISVVSSSKYEDDIRFNGNSIKESTANYMHGITGICSPIRRSKQMSVCGNFDKNSLAITDKIEGEVFEFGSPPYICRFFGLDQASAVSGVRATRGIFAHAK